MQDSIRIVTGTKKILINDGPDFLEFNPSDILFAERFYSLVQNFEKKRLELLERAKVLEENKAVDENGIPVTIAESLAIMTEAGTYMRGEIDRVFGKDTSQKLFGNSVTIDMFDQFFTQMAPLIQGARTKKMSKYIPTEKSKPARRKHK